MGDVSHPAARLVRAARAYSRLSRAQLGECVGVNAGTIGRWERGEWKKQPPRIAALEAVARHSGLLEAVEALAAAEGEDGARRFAEVARREAERQRGRPGAGGASPPGEDAEGGAL